MYTHIQEKLQTISDVYIGTKHNFSSRDFCSFHFILYVFTSVDRSYIYYIQREKIVQCEAAHSKPHIKGNSTRREQVDQF